MYKLLFILFVCAALPLLVFSQEPVVNVIQTPDTSVKYAVGDLLTLPASVQPYVRYLSLYNVPKSNRREVARLVSFTINSLSKRSKEIPVFVGASDETLIRINLKDYDIDPSQWDELGRKGSGPKAFPEPYFHAFATRIDEETVQNTFEKYPEIVLSWHVNYATARAQSAAKLRPMAIFFGNGANGYRSLVTDGFTDEISRILARQYVSVYIDTSTADGKSLAEQFEVPSGLVISDRTGKQQVFWHKGTLSRAVLIGHLNSYGGAYVDQVRIEKVTEIVPTGKVQRTQELLSAPWLDATAVQFLVKGTQSQFPILRADWFIVYSTVEPAYHKILGLGETEADFEKVVFADNELAKKARSQHKAVVIKSSVARNNRTLTRSPTFTNGYFWISHDTLTSVNDRNYVQNLLDEKFDATEIIATLPNGLQAYFVADGKGKRLDKADNEIATDHLSADKIVRTGRSCIYCHAPGINPIQDEVRTLNKKLLSREQVMLLVAREDDYYRIKDLFDSNLDKQIIRDQQIYADAIGEITGSSPTVIAKSYFNMWEGYSEYLLTKNTMAVELGITVAELDKYARLSNDPLFLGLVADPPRPVRRDQFERSFQDFLILTIRARANERPGVAPAIILDEHELKSKKKK